MFTIINHYQFTRFSTKMNPLIYYPPFCPSTTRSTLFFIFCIIKYKKRCVRIKVPHIRPDPGRRGVRLSPAAAETVSVLCPQLLRCVLLTLFQNIRGHGFFGWNAVVVFFSVGEPHRQHKRQKYTNGYGCNDSSFFPSNPVPPVFVVYIRTLFPCVATFLSLPEIILRLYIK